MVREVAMWIFIYERFSSPIHLRFKMSITIEKSATHLYWAM